MNKTATPENLMKAAFDGSLSDKYETIIRENVVEPFNKLQNVFNAASLMAWAGLAESAGVPSVGAKNVLEIPAAVLRRADELQPGDEVYAEKLGEVIRAVPGGHMLRWDCCASERLKKVMHTMDLDGIGQAAVALTPFDMRLTGILQTYPGENVAIVQRPWVPARMEGTHPVEYRVFVHGGEVIGISNYYVQRALPHDDTVIDEVAQCISHARAMIEAAQARNSVPWMTTYAPEFFEIHDVACSLDFLIGRDGQAMFLEAGPPFGAGAHPCCFMQFATPKDRSPDIVKGVLLGMDQPRLPIDEFLPENRAATAVRP